ncbi:MAG: hypothetical protein ACYTEZ_10970 [Planctomycetota bacterium]
MSDAQKLAALLRQLLRQLLEQGIAQPITDPMRVGVEAQVGLAEEARKILEAGDKKDGEKLPPTEVVVEKTKKNKAMIWLSVRAE